MERHNDPRTDSVRWDSDPPRPKKPGIPILDIRAGVRYDLTAVSDGMTRVWTHWTGHRTLPCKPSNCTLCLDLPEESLRKQGWLAMQGWPMKRLWLVCLTPGAMTMFDRLFPMDAGARGRCLVLGRKGSNTTGRMSVAISGEREYSGEMYPEPNVKAVLMEMWQSPLKMATIERHNAELEERRQMRDYVPPAAPRLFRQAPDEADGLELA